VWQHTSLEGRDVRPSRISSLANDLMGIPRRREGLLVALIGRLVYPQPSDLGSCHVGTSKLHAQGNPPVQTSSLQLGAL